MICIDSNSVREVRAVARDRVQPPTFGKRLCARLGVFAFAALSATGSIGAVTTRLVAAGATGNTATMSPGGTVSIDIRLDIGTLLPKGTGLTGTAFKISQLTPAGNGFFSITKRSFVGSPFNDASSGTQDAAVLAPPGNVLSPVNKENLGRTTVSSTVVRLAPNTLVVNLTLTASPATPPGIYRINITPGLSFAADDAFNEYDMSTGAPFTITVVAGPAAVTGAPKPSN
jgi:hypothetical protein